MVHKRVLFLSKMLQITYSAKTAINAFISSILVCFVPIKWKNLLNDFDKKINERCKMGGSGSGNYLRWSTKSTTGSQHRVDIRWLKKQRYLRPGAFGLLTWSRSDLNDCLASS